MFFFFVEMADLNLEKVARLLASSGLIDDRKFLLKKYAQCFVAREAISWLCHSQRITRPEALALCTSLVDNGIIEHVSGGFRFADEYLFFRFVVPIPPAVSGTKSDSVSLDANHLRRLCLLLKSAGLVADRKFLFKDYQDCFVAREAVDWICHSQRTSREEAVVIGRALAENRLIEHVIGGFLFADAYLFFRFRDERTNELAKKKRSSWAKSSNSHSSSAFSASETTTETSEEVVASREEMSGDDPKASALRLKHIFERKQLVFHEFVCDSAQVNGDLLVDNPTIVLLSDRILVFRLAEIVFELRISEIVSAHLFAKGHALLLVCGGSGCLLGLHSVSSDLMNLFLMSLSSASRKLKIAGRCWFVGHLLWTDNVMLDEFLQKLVAYEDALHCRTLIRMFGLNQKEVELMEYVIQMEVSRTLSSDVLFRENSLASTFLTEFMHETCSLFVQKAVFTYIDTLVYDNASEEVLDEVIVMDAQKVVDSLDVHKYLLPANLKLVFFKLAEIVEDKFLGASMISIASFLFLRCICVALIIPGSWGYNGKISPEIGKRCKR